MSTKEELETEIKELRAMLGGDLNARDLCGNCGHWRELHYSNNGGHWIGDRVGCPEYFGTTANAERRATKLDDIRKTLRATNPYETHNVPG